MIRKRKYSDYSMQLAIAQNPHVKKPKELWNKISRELKSDDEDDNSTGMNMSEFKSFMNRSKNIKTK